MRDIAHWNFPGFLVVLMQAVLVYLASAFLVPNVPESGRVDLRNCYFRETRWYSTALLLTVLNSLAKNLILWGKFQKGFDLAAHAGFVSVAGLVTLWERVHKVLAVAALVFFSVYIVLLFVPLPD